MKAEVKVLPLSIMYPVYDRQASHRSSRYVSTFQPMVGPERQQWLSTSRIHSSFQDTLKPDVIMLEEGWPVKRIPFPVNVLTRGEGIKSRWRSINGLMISNSSIINSFPYPRLTNSLIRWVLGIVLFHLLIIRRRSDVAMAASSVLTIIKIPFSWAVPLKPNTIGTG